MAQIVHYVDNIKNCAGLTPCHSTITDAVNAAAPSDSIEVFPGVYREAVAVTSKDHIVITARDLSLKAVIAPPAGANNAITVTGSPSLQIIGFVLEAPEAAGIRVCCGSNGVAIRSNLVKALQGITFRFGGHADNVISNNTFVGGGVSFPDGASSNLVEANKFDRGAIGMSEFNIGVDGNVIRRNFLGSGSISLLGARSAANNIVESNVAAGITIAVHAGSGATLNTIRHNLVRGGGILLQEFASNNMIERNFVSGSPADGIRVEVTAGDQPNVVRRNTSAGNAGCDINDASSSPVVNVWEQNRFITACGSATD